MTNDWKTTTDAWAEIALSAASHRRAEQLAAAALERLAHVGPSPDYARSATSSERADATTAAGATATGTATSVAPTGPASAPARTHECGDCPASQAA